MGVVVSNMFINQYQPRGMALYLGPKATQRIILVEPKSPSMQLLIVEVVERMYDKIGAKRPRTAVERGFFFRGFLAAGSCSDQPAAMNMKVDQTYHRMYAMVAANAKSRDKARAYYEWMRGLYDG
nr:hypothetical protein Iba_chr05eCG9110 [Ipomoea batatas]